MNQNKLTAAIFASAALALAVIFPTVNGTATANPFAEPVGIVAAKIGDPSVSFTGFVVGQDNNIGNLPDARGFNTVNEMQAAFKQFLIANNIQVTVGKHSYGIKRLLDTMLGNQIIDLELRQHIETVDLEGKLQATNPTTSVSLESYARSNGLDLPKGNLVTGGVALIAAVYSHHLTQLAKDGMAPTQANVMPYKQPVRAVA